MNHGRRRFTYGDIYRRSLRAEDPAERAPIRSVKLPATRHLGAIRHHYRIDQRCWHHPNRQQGQRGQSSFSFTKPSDRQEDTRMCWFAAGNQLPRTSTVSFLGTIRSLSLFSFGFAYLVFIYADHLLI